jgi:ABC-type multidrug transport system fused ATPase/permease subunit
MIKENDIGYDKGFSVMRISWSAVISGALVAIGLSFLLNIFTISIGLTAYTNSPDGNKVLVIGGYIGIVLCAMVSMFISGWVSGFLGHYKFNLRECFNIKISILHGFSSWCISLILSICLMANVDQFFYSKEHSLYHNEMIDKLTRDNFEKNGTLKKDSSSPDNFDFRGKNETKIESKNIGKSLFLTFILFFVGAVMSAYGACVGMCSQRRCLLSKSGESS